MIRVTDGKIGLIEFDSIADMLAYRRSLVHAPTPAPQKEQTAQQTTAKQKQVSIKTRIAEFVKFLHDHLTKEMTVVDYYRLQDKTCNSQTLSLMNKELRTNKAYYNVSLKVGKYNRMYWRYNAPKPSPEKIQTEVKGEGFVEISPDGTAIAKKYSSTQQTAEVQQDGQ